MSVHSYQCPNCGAPLQWTAGDGSGKGAVACEYCLGKFTAEEVIRYNEDLEAKIREEAAESPSDEKLQGFSEEEADLLRSYICDNCGAEVVSDSKTSATFCYYCHSPVILTDRISGKFRPEYIIPFQVSREEAVKRFLSWAKSKKFVPTDFYSDSQLEKMTGIYLPVWLARVKNDVQFAANASNTKKIANDKQRIDEYRVVRNGDITLENLVQVAFKTGDHVPPEAFETIANFRWEEKTPFSPIYLSGYFAELWGVSPEEAGEKAELSAQDLAENKVLQEVQAMYETVRVAQSKVTPELDSLDYILAPAWILTYEFNQKTYMYVLNGQTGETFGELPLDGKKLYQSAAVLALIILIILLLGGRFIW